MLSRKEYLADLQQRLERHLNPDEIAPRLAEVDAHLQEGIEGRIELGMKEEAAEREAIASFGDTHKVARSMIRQLLVRWDVARLGFLALAGIAYVVTAQVGVVTQRPDAYMAGLPIVVLFGGLFVSTAFVARRPATRAVVSVALLNVALLWVVSAVVVLNSQPIEGPKGSNLYVANRSHLPEMIQKVQGMAASHAEFDRNWAIFKTPNGLQSLNQDWGYKVPALYADGRIRYTTTDRRRAADEWERLHASYVTQTTGADLQQYLETLEDVRNHPLANAAKNLPGLLRFNLPLAGLAVIADFIFGFFGTLLLGTPRRKHGGGGLHV